MKYFAKMGLLAVLVVAAVGGAACKSKRPSNITPIPEYETEGGSQYVDIVPTGPMSSQPAATYYSPPPQSTTPPPPPPPPPYTPPRTQDVPPGGSFTSSGSSSGQDLRNQGGQNQWSNIPTNGQDTNTDTSKALTQPQDFSLPQGDLRDGLLEDRDMFRSIPVYFEFDRSAVAKSEMAKVGTVAEYLKSHNNVKLLVEGHCDERGTEGYNMALGERRALAVREVLMNLGVSGDRITTISYGDARPVDTRSNEAAYAKNRRGEFVVLGTSSTN
jgi:peptidoglycan-associated lipoprotein